MPQTASAKGSSRGGAATAPARKPVAKPPSVDEFVSDLTPVLEPYGWNEADIRGLVTRCGNDKIQVQEAISHYLEERQGHEHGGWSNIDTKDDKKEKSAMAKERKAQRDKERADEDEREKQLRQARIEEEKKRHLEKAARQEAYILSQKKQPGSALVRGTAPSTTTNAWQRQEETPVEAVKEMVEASSEQTQENRGSSTTANALGSTSQEESRAEANDEIADTSISKVEEDCQEPNAETREYKEDYHEPMTNGPEILGATENGAALHSESPVVVGPHSVNSDSDKADALRDFEMRLVQLEGTCNGDATRAEFRALWRCLARLLDSQNVAFGTVGHHVEPQVAQEDTWTAPHQHTSSSSTAVASINNGIAPQTQQAIEELDESSQAVCDSKGETGYSTVDDGKGKKGRSSRSKGDSKGEKGEKGDSKGGGSSDRRGKGKAWRTSTRDDRQKGKGKSPSS